MKDEKQTQQEPIDPNLDIPAEASRNKHINFLDAENENSTKANHDRDDITTERRKQWQEGLREGEDARRNNES